MSRATRLREFLDFLLDSVIPVSDIIGSMSQTNADITKPEIEAVLTGEISSHTHAGNVRGVSAMSLGTVTISTSAVTANSLIFLTPQTLGTVTRPVGVGVTARTPGVSFVITSQDITDTSTVSWVIFEPAI